MEKLITGLIEGIFFNLIKVARDEDPYGLVDNGGGDYCDPDIIGCSNTDSCMFALRLQPNFHMGEGSDLTT